MFCIFQRAIAAINDNEKTEGFKNEKQSYRQGSLHRLVQKEYRLAWDDCFTFDTMCLYESDIHVNPRKRLYISVPCTAKATYQAISKTYAYLTPDLWKETVFIKSPYQEYTDYLSKHHTRVAVQKQEQKVY